MNPRYRKQTRLRSRHHRRGHTPWCRCWEPLQRLVIAVRRRLDSGRPLPTRTVRIKPYEQDAA